MAAPLVQELAASGHPTTLDNVAGLNEIPAGAFEGDPMISLRGSCTHWAHSCGRWAMCWSRYRRPSANGARFDESFGGAVQSIYDGPRARPHADRRRILE